MTKKYRKGLLVVDVQKGFISSYTQRCLPRIYELLHDEEYDAVIATRFFNPKGSLFRTQLNWTRLADPTETALDTEVEAVADYVVDKTGYSAGQPLLDTIQQEQLDHVTVVGIDTDVCVLVNAALLFDAGIPVSVDTTACATNGGAEAEKVAVKLLWRYVGRDFVED